jgi:arsenate reductase (thioredoxin)
MKVKPQTIKSKINDYCQELEKEFDLIPAERKEKLLSLRQYIAQKFKEQQTPKLVVICTHNSRRSHIGQIWLAVAADYYQLPDIQTFSGGTEATAFNIRAVEAFRRIGFSIKTDDKNATNPIYSLSWKNKMAPYLAFSKKYEDAPNPSEQFAAIMVCSEADAGCPFVFGCDFRLSLPFEDPKAFDETDLETEKYDERVRQIGRELFFVLSGVKG